MPATCKFGKFTGKTFWEKNMKKYLSDHAM